MWSVQRVAKAEESLVSNCAGGGGGGVCMVKRIRRGDAERELAQVV